MKTKLLWLLVVAEVLPVLADPPSSFDLRDVDGENLVTSVKSQTGGTCWTHAAMAAMEGNLLLTGNWEAAGETGEPNLAEYHLDWWNGFNQHNNDDLDPPSGDGLEVHYGGDYRVTAAYLARGEGAVRDVDGQSYSTPPPRSDPAWPLWYPRHIEWTTAGENLEHIDRVKERVMDYGVMGTCMYYNSQFIHGCTHYQPPDDPNDPNHAVAIIGWDDARVTDAPEPGAWLIKNSWGTGWCNEGYFWISYYDKHAGKHPEMGAVTFRDVDLWQWDRTYSHDYHGWRDTLPAVQRIFNHFVCLPDTGTRENLAAVSFYTPVDSVDWTVRLYDGFDGSQLAGLRMEQSGHLAYTGLHTIDLTSPVSLLPGRDFYLELELDHGGQPFDRTSEIPVLLGSDQRTIVRSTAAEGESWYFEDDVWKPLWDYPEDWAHSANFCVKGLVTVQECAGLTPVDDLVITRDSVSSQLRLDWTPVPCAWSYRVETATDPYAAEVDWVEVVETTESAYQFTPGEIPRFFRVIALAP